MFRNKSKSRLSKKTRNTISGLFVGAASIFAVSAYMDVPLDELRGIFGATLLFFGIIILLAVLCISIIILIRKLKRQIKTDKQNE